VGGCVTLVACLFWPSEYAGADEKLDFVNSQSFAIVTGGNGIYRVHLQDAAGGTCGTWTATTGPLHPAGSGLNVLYGQGTPVTSNTTLRSYTSGVDYITGNGGPCSELCVAAGAPESTPILNGATTVGYRFVWTLADGGNSIVFTQEVVVVGPVDGTETVDNTVVRETHTILNTGPGSFSFGLRKHWDWQIGPDDGPWFGDCDTPTAACDVSMNLTADGSLHGPYPQSYVINEEPATSDCPGTVVPIDPDGCPGNPLYIVAGTVAPPSTLSPPPDAPEILQFNSWPSTFGACWEPGLVNNANCPGGDTAVAYFYGRTMASALVLGPGQQRSLTEYIVAGLDACPEILTPGACCNDGTGVCTIELASDCMFRYGGDGSDCGTISPPCAFCGNGILEGTEQCDEGAANGTPGSCCSATCTFVSAGTVCRSAAGACDAAESCTGGSAACPSDGYLPGSSVCRPAAGACDVAENCTGGSASCPGDAFLPSTTVCRPTTGECDPAENCTGTGPICPPNMFAPPDTPCEIEEGGGEPPPGCPPAGSCDEGGNCVKAGAPSPKVILPGDDPWKTVAEGLSYMDFSTHPIPAGFFGPMSNPFSGIILLEGEPLDPATMGNTDTIVRRLDTVSLPCTSTAMTEIKLVALSLKGDSSITVTFSNGDPPEQWNVKVCLSDCYSATLPDASCPGLLPSDLIGSMTISRETLKGGSFSTTALPVYAKFVFTSKSDGQMLTLDFGHDAELVAFVRTMKSAVFQENGPWVMETELDIVTVPPGALVDGNCDGMADPPLIGSNNFIAGIKCTPVDPCKPCKMPCIDDQIVEVPEIWPTAKHTVIRPGPGGNGDDGNGIPTVSQWGLVIMTLLLLAGWKLYFGRTSPASPR
jgi:hypothetical protein